MTFEPDPADLALSSIPGHETFDPRRHRFSEEELKPQPIMKKARKIQVPEEQKVSTARCGMSAWPLQALRPGMALSSQSGLGSSLGLALKVPLTYSQGSVSRAKPWGVTGLRFGLEICKDGIIMGCSLNQLCWARLYRLGAWTRPSY